MEVLISDDTMAAFLLGYMTIMSAIWCLLYQADEGAKKFQKQKAPPVGTDRRRSCKEIGG